MSDKEKKYFLVKLRFHLGYSIRKSFTSGSIDSYIIPPKSTIIGAIAMANSARNGIHSEYLYDNAGEIYSNAYKYKDCIKYIAYNYEYKPINFMSMTRMSILLYAVRKEHLEESIKRVYNTRFGPLYLGMTSYYNELLKVFLVIENERGCKITLNKKDLYSITRLGSKESVVSVVEVLELNQNNIEKISKKHKIHNIKFSFPSDMKGIDLSSMSGSYFIENVIEDEKGITYSFNVALQTSSLIIKTYIVPNPIVSITSTGNESLCLFKTTEGNIIAPGELC